MNRHKVVFAVAGLVAASAVAGCDGGSETSFGPASGEGNYQGTFQSDGVERSYFVHTPPSWEAGISLPLLIALHGVPSNGQQLRASTGLDESADEFGYVVAYPNSVFMDWAMGCECTQAEFEGVNDVRFIQRLIGELRANLGIDRTRVFVAGFSQGALMTHKLACSIPSELAGVASVAATMLDRVASQCTAGSPVPALFIHGTEDQEFPREGRVEPHVSSISLQETLDVWVQINGCASNPAIVMEPDTSDDGTTVERWTYQGCDPGGPLVLYDVVGGGHTWPGAALPSNLGVISRDISANEVISRFFLF